MVGPESQAVLPRSGSLNVRVWLAAAASLLVYGLVGGFTLQGVGLSADAVSAWATAEPHRTVLCVDEDPELGLRVAADPSDADLASVGAPLSSRELRAAAGPVGLHLRQHTYRLTLSVFGIELPWMKNDYTAGWPDLPAHIAWSVFHSPRAGQGVHLVLGGLVLLLASLLAGRLAGWPATLVTGVWLASDPWFLVYKRLLGGHEVMLQLLGVLGVALLGAACLRRHRGLFLAGMLVCGVGLHVKPTFVAVLACAVIPALALLASPRHPRVRRALPLGALLLALGAAPTALAWVASSSMDSAPASVVGSESAHGRWSALRSGEERRRDDIKTRTTAIDVLLWPDVFWERHWRLIGARTEQRAPDAAAPRSPASVAATGLALALLLLGLAGVGVLARRVRGEEGTMESRLALALSVMALLMPVLLRLLSPDPHHLALWVPFAAMALGVTLAAVARRSSVLVCVLVALALVLPARVLTLVEVDEALELEAGRLSTATGQERLAASLLRLGATSPAMLDYNVMSLMEAWSDGAVRPWLYSRAALNARRGCVAGAREDFLSRILEAHAGGHVVFVAGLDSGSVGRPDPHRTSKQMAMAAREAGVLLQRTEVVTDDHGRWMADIWAVRDKPTVQPFRAPPPSAAPWGGDPQ